jgi:transposase-like protein
MARRAVLVLSEISGWANRAAIRCPHSENRPVVKCVSAKQAQLCLVYMVRHSLSFVSHRDRKQVATDLKAIYQATILEEAEGK